MGNTFSYTNRKGKTYFFREVEGKRGKRIACSTKESESDLSAIPDTHEIVERPNGQVSCRVKMASDLSEEEIALARELCPKLVRKGVETVVEVRKKELLIHSREFSELEGFVRNFSGIRHGAFDALAARVPFQAVLKFELVDRKNRTFAAHRRCWMGGPSDWLFLGKGTLSAMLKKYVVHIEQESFYNLL
jgi:hypothetical protein